MKPRIIPKKNPEEASSAELLEAVFQNLNLSEDNRAKARFYHRLSQLPEISDNGLFFTERMWEQAQDDKQLETVLSFIDGLIPPCLTDKPLLAENADMRTYLQEHIQFLSAGKLKHKKSDLHSQNEPSVVTFFCPDGSGIFQPNSNTEGVVDIDSHEICPQCQHELSQHRQRIKIGSHVRRGASVSQNLS